MAPPLYPVARRVWELDRKDGASAGQIKVDLRFQADSEADVGAGGEDESASADGATAWK